MQQVKLFVGLEGETEELTREINDWIRQSGAKILQVTGNIAPQSSSNSGGPGLSAGGRVNSDVLVVVLYEES